MLPGDLKQLYPSLRGPRTSAFLQSAPAPSSAEMSDLDLSRDDSGAADTTWPTRSTTEQAHILIAYTGSQFEHASTGIPTAALGPTGAWLSKSPRHFFPVAVTSRSGSVTLRRYLSDDGDEREYWISRARIPAAACT